ncbi:hypothetical protein ACIQXD_29650 [Streptomyces uncialis]|uniref:hypothetical protein n=1 Tax=Streptomyces uncialis TaxID=1048205 RepID=UPI003804773C
MSGNLNVDLHTAISGVLHDHGLGMLSRAVVAVEIVDSDGDIGLLTGTLPEDMPSWDRVGMLEYSLAHSHASLVAVHIADDEDDEGT